jgi:hypothetical protein
MSFRTLPPPGSTHRHHAGKGERAASGVRQVTNWIAAGAAAAVVVLVGVAAHETPAHHSAGTSTVPGTSSQGSAPAPVAPAPAQGATGGSATPSDGGTGGSSSSGFSQAPSAPAPTSLPPQVVTGQT